MKELKKIKTFKNILLGDVGNDPLEMITVAIKNGAEILKEISKQIKSQFGLDKFVCQLSAVYLTQLLVYLQILS